jgi:hypothetical protein
MPDKQQHRLFPFLFDGGRVFAFFIRDKRTVHETLSVFTRGDNEILNQLVVIFELNP